jgi:hypothetical protein
VDFTEDDDATNYRPQAAGSSPDNAVDVAVDVWLSQYDIPQRAGSLLGRFQRYPDRYAVFRHRLGWSGFAKSDAANTDRC